MPVLVAGIEEARALVSGTHTHLPLLPLLAFPYFPHPSPPLGPLVFSIMTALTLAG